MITKQDFDQKIKEANNLKLNRLKEIEALILNKEICLFGYGNKGRIMARQLKAKNVELSIIDNNPDTLKKAEADGFKVIDTLSNAHPDKYCYILGSGQYQLEQQIAVKTNYIFFHECTYYFDLPHLQESTRLISDVVIEFKDDLFRIYQQVHPLHQNVFLAVLLFRASLNPVYLQPVRSHVQKMWVDVPTYHNSGRYKSLCDVGAYDGDTILAFSNNFDIDSAIAVEVNSEFNERIISNSSALKNGVEIVPFAAWSNATNLSFKEDHNGMFSVFPDEKGKIAADTLDNLVKSKIDVLKLDIEGSELEALEGAKKIIQEYKPDIFIAAYHRPADFFMLTDTIFNLVEKENYSLGVGHYSDIFDDTIFYFLKSSDRSN
jgi:FkbM family methyltransferase